MKDSIDCMEIHKVCFYFGFLFTNVTIHVMEKEPPHQTKCDVQKCDPDIIICQAESMYMI